MPVYWLVFWSVTEAVIFIAAVRAWWSRRAMYAVAADPADVRWPVKARGMEGR